MSYPTEEEIRKWMEYVQKDSLEYLYKVINNPSPNSYRHEFVQLCREEIIRRLNLDRVC